MPLVRLGPVGAVPGGGRGLSGPAPTIAGAVRPALELALKVAKKGEAATPPQPAPRGLKRFLGFARLPAAALEAVRRELDSDDGFRQRVAGAATEDAVGRASWLFLTRPEGWRAELATLVAEASPGDDADDDQERVGRADRDLSRRVRSAEEGRQRADAARGRAEKSLAAEREKATRLGSELAEERRRRRHAEKELEDTRRRLASALSAVDSAERRARQHQDRAEAALARAAEIEGGDRNDPEALSAAVTRLLDAAAGLDRAVSDIEGLARPRGPSKPAGRRRRAQATPQRAPLPLPPGVLDDSAEAAEALVRSPGVVVLVDGYNASMALWPDLAVGQQRQRLVDALAEMAARTGADVRVVFDGSEAAGTQITAPRSAVKASFSPADVEADDVIIATVGTLPATQPVVVASDDRRVRRGAERQGGNVITTTQLAAVLRR